VYLFTAGFQNEYLYQSYSLISLQQKRSNMKVMGLNASPQGKDSNTLRMEKPILAGAKDEEAQTKERPQKVPGYTDPAARANVGKTIPALRYRSHFFLRWKRRQKMACSMVRSGRIIPGAAR
jgi:hypothetical protein